jgi:uncharacterized protein
MSTDPSAPHADDVTRSPGAPSSGFLPPAAQIRALHRRLAPTEAAFALVHTHCVIVAELAAQLLATRPQPVDAALVHAGCLLHDVGVYRLYDAQGRLDRPNYLRHGILGEQVLRELGLPDVLCRFCSHHTGVGLTRDDVVRHRLPLPVADYLAETPEEEVVMYADTFHSKSDPPSLVTPRLARAELARFGADKVARYDELADRYGVPDLAPLAAAWGHEVRDA